MTFGDNFVHRASKREGRLRISGFGADLAQAAGTKRTAPATSAQALPRPQEPSTDGQPWGSQGEAGARLWPSSDPAPLGWQGRMAWDSPRGPASCQADGRRGSCHLVPREPCNFCAHQCNERKRGLLRNHCSFVTGWGGRRETFCDANSAQNNRD